MFWLISDALNVCQFIPVVSKIASNIGVFPISFIEVGQYSIVTRLLEVQGYAK